MGALTQPGRAHPRQRPRPSPSNARSRSPSVTHGLELRIYSVGPLRRIFLSHQPPAWRREPPPQTAAPPTPRNAHNAQPVVEDHAIHLYSAAQRAEARLAWHPCRAINVRKLSGSLKVAYRSDQHLLGYPNWGRREGRTKSASRPEGVRCL